MKSGALRIALIYVTIACLWILFSDKALYTFHNSLNPATYGLINSGKGFLFVFITSYFLYKLICADEQKIIEATTKSVQANNEVKRLGDIITRINNFVIITDTNNYITWVNKAFEDFTGYTLAEIAGYTPATFFIDGESEVEVMSYVLANKRAMRPFSVEIYCRKKSGAKFCVYSEYTPLFDNKRQFTGYIGVYSDITNLKQQLQEAARQNIKLKEIAWLCSHEVRRPLANIIGLANLMKSTPYADEKIKIVESISASAEDLDKIVQVLNLTVSDELEQNIEAERQP